MNNKLKEILNVIWGLIIFVIIGFLIFILVKSIANLIITGIKEIVNIASNADSVVIVALITGGISIVTVFISSIVSKIIEYRQTTKRYLYEKREKPYSDFIEMVYRLQMSQKSKEEYTQEQMQKDILGFSQLLTLWGSSKVIKKWLRFREISQEKNVGPQNLFILEDIIFEIRKDMGQKKKGLKQGDILAFFVNDIKKYLPERQTSKNGKS